MMGDSALIMVTACGNCVAKREERGDSLTRSVDYGFDNRWNDVSTRAC